MDDYRVNLEIYNGPMDLLLYLIRRDEIDIHDIPISKITEQYCSHMEVIKQIDPDVAGEFLVLAATLMEIKTRLLLPHIEDGGEGDEGFDPRADLVRQLLEYKAFKDAANDLRVAAADQALRFPRRPAHIEHEPEGLDLEEVQVWDLVGAFNELMTSIGQESRLTEIIYDDTPIELHATDILDRLARDGNMTFAEIFTGRSTRLEMVGLFLALLELIRRRHVYVEQKDVFGDIYVFHNPEPPAEEGQADEAAKVASPAGAGQYVSHTAPPERAEENDDDNPAKGAGAGA